MSDWSMIFYFSIISATLLLSVMGVWFTAVIPGIDRWSKRFFRCYFMVFLLCCVSSIVEVFLESHHSSAAMLYFALVVECLLLSAPLPMLTVYLLHCRGRRCRGAGSCATWLSCGRSMLSCWSAPR